MVEAVNEDEPAEPIRPHDLAGDGGEALARRPLRALARRARQNKPVGADPQGANLLARHDGAGSDHALLDLLTVDFFGRAIPRPSPGNSITLWLPWW